MGLRCKPNELCFILGEPYAGYVVTTIRFLGESIVRERSTGRVYSKNNVWEVTYPQGFGPHPETNGVCVVADDNLLPIRPDELKEDEEKEVTTCK